MSGERDLKKLLAGLTPVLDEETYVFTCLPDDADISGLTPLMQFTEEEGITLILPKHVADREGLKCDFTCRRITLSIHSALDASGLMAAVSTALANKDIPCNPVAGFHHDHLFVPVDRAEEAMIVLHGLSAKLS